MASKGAWVVGKELWGGRASQEGQVSEGHGETARGGETRRGLACDCALLRAARSVLRRLVPRAACREARAARRCEVERCEIRDARALRCALSERMVIWWRMRVRMGGVGGAGWSLVDCHEGDPRVRRPTCTAKVIVTHVEPINKH